MPTHPTLFDELHEGIVPSWARTVAVFDLETTGIDVETDRIVTAHVGVLDASGHVLRSRTWLADPGIAIPEGATAVHGITTAHATTHGLPAHDVVAAVLDELRAILDHGIAVVAYNAAYDFSLLRNEALRHGLTPIDAPSPVIDPYVVDRTFDRYRRGKRTLDVVAAHYDVSLDDAHDAEADAVAAGRVAQAIARRYSTSLPADVIELHTAQVAWARAQAASLTEYFISIGRMDADDTIDGSWPVRASTPAALAD